MMSCLKCKFYTPINREFGNCQLNPPVLSAGKPAGNINSWTQPMTYADWDCAKSQPVESVEVDSEKEKIADRIAVDNGFVAPADADAEALALLSGDSTPEKPESEMTPAEKRKATIARKEAEKAAADAVAGDKSE